MHRRVSIHSLNHCAHLALITRYNLDLNQYIRRICLLHAHIRFYDRRSVLTLDDTKFRDDMMLLTQISHLLRLALLDKIRKFSAIE